MSDFSLFFNDHFKVETAPEHEILDEALRLRYQVYCLERGLLNHGSFVDGREFDHFDTHALHAIVRHRATGHAIATVRLVRKPTDTPETLFPLETTHPNLLWQHGLTNQVLPRSDTAEISRFAISKKWQQHERCRCGNRQDNALARAGQYFNGRRYPLAIFGLFVALMRMSAQHKITHWVAIMEPSLLRLLARFGIRFESIGGLVDYYGKRQPCYGRVTTLHNGLQDTEINLFDLIKRDLEQNRAPAISPGDGSENAFDSRVGNLSRPCRAKAANEGDTAELKTRTARINPRPNPAAPARHR